MQSPKQNTLFVNSLEKGLRLLSAFDEAHPELGLADLCKRTGLDKSAAQRFANTLVQLSYLEKDPASKRYRPALRILEHANAFLCSNSLVQRTSGQLTELSITLRCSINLAVLDGTDIVYLHRAPWRHTRFAASVPGRRIPALNTSSGRAIISTLSTDARQIALQTWPIEQFTPRTTMDRNAIADQVELAAERGYCTAQDELLVGETASAAPLLKSGIACAAVQAAYNSRSRRTEDDHKKIIAHLTDTALSLQMP